MCSPRSDKPLDSYKQEIAMSEGRLKEPLLVKRLVRAVANKIENKVHYFTSSENCAALFDPSGCELLHRPFDRAHARKGSLSRSAYSKLSHAKRPRRSAAASGR